MNKASSVIEINGTSYDAASGKVIGSAKKFASHVKNSAQVIDGFVRKSDSTSTKNTTKAAPKPMRASKAAKQVHSRTQKSRALMRGVVSKPKADITGAAKNLIKPSMSKAVEREQERRSIASAVTKDSRVKRFGITKPLQTKPAPKPIVAKARPMTTASASVKAVPAPLPSMVVSASHAHLERMLDEALLRADAHKQMLKARSRNPLDRLGRMPRWLAIVILLVVAILVTAFIVWRSMPQVTIKIAGQEAHVNASLPAYAPTGFSVAHHISHASGAVTVKYQSDTDSADTYDITQKTSSWDSSSLAANVIQPSTQVQTSQVQGTTVYIYGKDSDATWVNNGVWYTLKNNANLTSDQILHIVQSL